MNSKINRSHAIAWYRVDRALFTHRKILALNVCSFLAIAFFSGTFLTSAFLFIFVLANFSVSRLLARADQERTRETLYGLSVLANVSCFFLLQHQGYIGILDSKNASAPATLPWLMGFAFYVLQALAIQGAIFRRVIGALDFQRYVLAVSFCGAFLAGPIFNEEQLKKFEKLEVTFPDPSRIYQYLHLLVGALVFKYVFANWISQWVSLDEALSPLLIARSVVCFELQVYFDFAGYSLLSYFLCRIFCIPIYHNFQHPFAARNIPEFWRRWHVGLGTFFKENVFLPLKARYPQRLATRVILPLTVFLLSALWHGPTRNFVLWGLFHGLAFALSVVILRRWQNQVVLWGARLSVFAVLFYGRLLFMESDFERLMQKFRRLGMFKLLGQEIAQLLATPWHLAETMLKQWDSSLIGLGMAAILTYEIFLCPSPKKGGYRYFRPGIWAFALLLLMLLFFQPAQHGGFVYGR